MPGDECGARLFQKRLASELHELRVAGRFGHKAEALARCQVADQGVDGVVAVELGFLKRKQVRLLDKGIDAPLETRQANLA